MQKYTYLSKREKNSYQEISKQIIHKVQDNLRSQFTFRYDFIGSSKYNLVTFCENNKPDLDCDIQVNDEKENFSAENIIDLLINSFNKYLIEYNFISIEKNSRTFTLKGDEFDLDIAVVYHYFDDKDKSQYIRYNKHHNNYTWQYNSLAYYLIENKIKIIKDNDYWADVEEKYLEKKNTNTNPHKKSRSLFLEVINNIYNENNLNESCENEEEYDEDYYYYDDWSKFFFKLQYLFAKMFITFVSGINIKNINKRGATAPLFYSTKLS